MSLSNAAKVHCRTTLICLSLCFAWASQAGAQQDAASIIGQVKDESGAVLPGVTVSAKSPALQTQELTAVTDERGQYRLTPLPLGTYDVAYTLSGFQSLRREGVRLTAGFTAQLDVALKVGSLEETVTVSGASPVVDVRSTATTTQLTRETLELTPTGRNGIVALMVQAPGVRTNLDVGGSTINDVPVFRAYGQSQESWGTLEGVLTTSPKDTQSGNYYDYASFEEAKVEAIGKNAEVPVRGIQMTAIVKSGGNDFHGGSWFGYTTGGLQSSNITPEVRAQGITSGNRIDYRRDVSGDIGGRIVRNKLWFYNGGRERAGSEAVLGVLKPDGTPAKASQRQGFFTEKVSYQMSQSNRLVGFYNWSMKREVRGMSVLVPWESRTDQGYRGHTGKVEWQRVHSNTLVTSLQVGHWRWRADYYPSAPNTPAAIDRVTLLQSGDNINSSNYPGEWRHHASGNATWYRPNVLGGNHDLRAGFDYIDTTVNRKWYGRTNGGKYGSAGNYRLGFRSGVADVLETFNYPVDPLSASHYLGLYLRDSWTIGRRLTVNAGLRYAHDRGFVPQQCREDADPVGFAPAQCFDEVNFNVWNTVAPRIGVSYDLTGDGKTVVKGGWGRFDHMREIEEVLPANRNIAATTTWRWRDLNGNRDYDAGEVNLNPNGSDFLSVAARDTGLFSNGIPNPDEKEPKVDQFNASIEREVMRNFAVRITGIHSKSFNVYRALNTRRPFDAYNIPITVVDPGPDGVAGSGDDPGRSFTYLEFPASLAGVANQIPTLINDPRSDATYSSMEFAASKRLSSRWQMMASYSATKVNEPHVPESPFNPITEILDARNFWEWTAKVSGVYILPYDISLAVNYVHNSGTPQQRTILVRAPQSGNINLNVEPYGSFRLPNVNLSDARIEKTFRVGTNKVAARVNVYNLLNSGSITAWSVQSGPNFRRPTTILPPRIVEFSASIAF